MAKAIQAAAMGRSNPFDMPSGLHWRCCPTWPAAPAHPAPCRALQWLDGQVLALARSRFPLIRWALIPRLA